MQINNRGEFEATARVYKHKRQWIIRIEELPEWVVNEIKDELPGGFGDPSPENQVDHTRVIVLEGRYYSG